VHAATVVLNWSVFAVCLSFSFRAAHLSVETNRYRNCSVYSCSLQQTSVNICVSSRFQCFAASSDIVNEGRTTYSPVSPCWSFVRKITLRSGLETRQHYDFIRI